MKLIGLLMLAIVGLSGLRTGKSDNSSVALSSLNTPAVVTPTPVAQYDITTCREQIGIPNSVKNAWFVAARTDNMQQIYDLYNDFPQILNIQDDNGNTALITATTFQKCDTIAALMYLGADSSITNTSYHSALYGQGEGVRNDMCRKKGSEVGVDRIRAILKNRNICPSVCKQDCPPTK